MCIRSFLLFMYAYDVKFASDDIIYLTLPGSLEESRKIIPGKNADK